MFKLGVKKSGLVSIESGRKEDLKIIYGNFNDIGVCMKTKKGRYIELNKNLKKYPKLHKKVLLHEIEHYNSKNVWEDFKIDLRNIFDFKLFPQLELFALKHKCYGSFIPFGKDKKGEWWVNQFTLLIHLINLILLILLFII